MHAPEIYFRAGMSAKATASVYNFNDDLDLSVDVNSADSTSVPTDTAYTSLLRTSSREIASENLNDVKDRISTVPPLAADFIDQITSPDVKLGRVASEGSLDRIATGMVGGGTAESNGRPESYPGWGNERNNTKINDSFVSRGAKSYINTRSGVSLDRLDEGDYYDGTTDLTFGNSLNSNMGRDNYGPGYRSNSNASNYSVDTELYRMGIAEDRPRNDSVYSFDQESVRDRDKEFEKEARQKAAEKISLSPRPTTSTSRPHAHHGGIQYLLLHHLEMQSKLILLTCNPTHNCLHLRSRGR